VSAWVKWSAGGVACVAIGGYAGWNANLESSITFLSVGQGDSTLIQHQGAAILIDTGPTLGGSDAGARLVVPKLRQRGVTRLDGIFLTHPDSDHVGGTRGVLEAYPGVRIFVSDQFRDHPSLQRRMREWRVRDGQVVWLPQRSKARFGRFDIELYAPEMNGTTDDNDGSLFIRLSANGATAVFSGDASVEVEAVAAARGDWQAQVMKAGHHGSRTSTGWPWLREVKPEHVVVSCGRDNSYGHPHRQVVERVAEVKAKLHRTDREGDIRFEVAGGRFRRVK
jgi:competence protein ComEC